MAHVAGELTRTTTHEADDSFPDRLEMVAHFGTKRRTITITKDQFFGLGGFGAPMTGDQLIRAIENLRFNRRD